MNKVIKVSMLLVLTSILFFQIKLDQSRPIAVSVKVDSIKKTLVIPSIENSIKFENPKLKTNVKVIDISKPTKDNLNNKIKELENKLKRKADSLDILKELYEASLVREYRETYKDSLIEFTFDSRVKGFLLESYVDYKLLKREIEYIEKIETITKIIPSEWYLSAGATFADQSLYGTINYTSKKGNSYDFGWNGGSKFMFGFKIPITKRKQVKYN